MACFKQFAELIVLRRKIRTMVITDDQGKEVRFRHNQTVSPYNKSDSFNKERNIIYIPFGKLANARSVLKL